MSVDGRCFKHGFELAENTCRNCGLDFCAECLVYSFGADKPPYCIPCALGSSGVRSNAGRASGTSKRELKKLEKEKRKADKSKSSKSALKVEAEPNDAKSPKSAEDNPFAWADEQDSKPVAF